MRKVLTRSCLMILVLAATACNGESVAKPSISQASKAQEMTLAQAKLLISKGKDLNTIPKSIWKQLLKPQQYKILWEKGTEPRDSGTLKNNKRSGVYRTVGCKIPVFHTNHKYESGSGWPAFWEALDKNNIILKDDSSWGMKRTEVLSACGEHLGHVFDDGPAPTGLRYCINSLALEFVEEVGRP